LLGPPGSGKSTIILNEIRGRLDAGREDFLFLAPTSTMAEHVANRLARMGYVFRASSIGTLAGFVGKLALPGEAVTAAALDALLRDVLAEECPAAFRGVAGLAGFRAALARAVEELANAGCGSLQLAALEGLGVSRGLHASALAEVLRALEERLIGRDWALRPERLLAAARMIRAAPGPAAAVYLDGFFSLTLAERELVRALAAGAAVTVALPEWPGATSTRVALLEAGFREERLHPVRPAPRIELAPARNREQEALFVAGRLLAEHAAGRRWREMGVVLRAERPYAPILATTFARLGIPVRFYFAQPLRDHALIRFLSILVEAALAGWPLAGALAALRMPVARAAADPHFDAFEKAVREALPAAGWEALDACAGAAEEVRTSLATLRESSRWAEDAAEAAEWAVRLASLSRLAADPPAEPAAADLDHLGRRAAALRAWRDALSEAASLAGPGPIPLSAFWEQARACIAFASLRTPDRRRDVVHVLDVYEARQWELPVVFLCGLLEGEFPRRAAADPLLGDDLRLRLAAAGFPLDAAASRQQVEEFLFQLAFTRAAERLYLTWPAAGEDGEPLQRAFALDRLGLAEASVRPARIRGSGRRRTAAPLHIASSESLACLAEASRRHRATALESFLQCPFQYFARHTLALEPLPPSPGERLDFAALGSFLHRFLSEWLPAGGPLQPDFDRAWAAFLRKLRSPASHRAEMHRLTLLRGLERFAAEPLREPERALRLEAPVRLDFGEFAIEGRIDRYDEGPGGECAVIDYKLSSEAALRRRVEKSEANLQVQAGLYAAALEAQGKRVESFHFVALRSKAIWRGWTGRDEIERLMEGARQAAWEAHHRIRAGEIAPAPADPEQCGYCEFRDACRVTSAPAAAPAASE
jgi:ATP-dependent helicase/DNAse subunit B